MELNGEMTNKEAIEWLVAIEEKYIHGGDEVFDNQRRTALHLARNALALIKQLTQAHEMLSESYDALEKTKDELLAERSRLAEVNALQTITLIEFDKQVQRLTEENERLRVELRDEIAKGEMCAEVIKRQDKEKEIMHESFVKLETLYKIERKRVDTIKADTVREMQERFTKEFDRMHKSNFLTVEVRQWIIDQIAKEMLEGDDA